MELIYAYPAERGRGVEAEIVGTLRDRFGAVVQTAREERDAERGRRTDVFVTLDVTDDRAEAALTALRAHPLVIDAAARSFGERV
ncbi:hypothetical protein VY88_02885 [Azospirillum thiophilum]|uniref:Uncharacterized protein n=1 Tax=Azospirillum thiophilum TaxID=528244 RepID=A0AAC8VX60_9PROT|nr:hypothetical protein [Azospirillum thiophilum]ALG71158.1 hypothetical protein AL072_09825 [Azospirillum thiophilum]KJR65186.1 hypothetical protein VY88_02885 [Azospirillum thiophilum]